MNLNSTTSGQPDRMTRLGLGLGNPRMEIAGRGSACDLNRHDASRWRDGDQISEAKEITRNKTMRDTLFNYANSPVGGLQKIDAGAVRREWFFTGFFHSLSRIEPDAFPSYSRPAFLPEHSRTDFDSQSRPKTRAADDAKWVEVCWFQLLRAIVQLRLSCVRISLVLQLILSDFAPTDLERSTFLALHLDG